MSKQTFEDVFIEIAFRKNAGDMNAVEMLRAYATLLAEKENNGTTHWNGTTHYAGCVGAGPKHYECALAEISRLRLTITHLQAELEKKTWFSAYEKKPWVDLTKEELQTIFNYEPNDVKHIAFLVESLCKEKNT